MRDIGQKCNRKHVHTEDNSTVRTRPNGHQYRECLICKKARDKSRTVKDIKLDESHLDTLKELEMLVPGNGDLIKRVKNMVNELQFIGNLE